MSAKCTYCDQEMSKGVACTTTHYPAKDFPDRKRRARTPYGEERRVKFGWSPCNTDKLEPPLRERFELADDCKDCNTPLGSPHHPGCDVELCPACHWQAIACWCKGFHKSELDTSTVAP